MPREADAYLWGVADAAEKIQQFLSGKTISDYLKDELLRSAVARKLAIIGEALANLLHAFPDYRDRVSFVTEIIGLRNRIVHGYETVKNDLIWQITQTHLPKLKAEVAQLLRES